MARPEGPVDRVRIRHRLRQQHRVKGASELDCGAVAHGAPGCDQDPGHPLQLGGDRGAVASVQDQEIQRPAERLERVLDGLSGHRQGSLVASVQDQMPLLPVSREVNPPRSHPQKVTQQALIGGRQAGCGQMHEGRTLRRTTHHLELHVALEPVRLSTT